MSADTAQQKELNDLVNLLDSQNSLIENLEKELQQLTTKDSNVELVNNLKAENDKLKTTIDELNSKLKNKSSGSVSATPAAVTNNQSETETNDNKKICINFDKLIFI